MKREMMATCFEIAGALLVAVVFAVVPLTASAAPPYDVTATFTPPAVDATHGAPTGYRLYKGCATGQTKALVGTVTSGQKFTGLLTVDGSYSFCVHAFNATGEGPRSNIANVVINDYDPAPGAATNFTVTVSCDASCTVEITSTP